MPEYMCPAINGPPALRSNDFAAAKFFREAERSRTGGTGGVAPPLG